MIDVQEANRKSQKVVFLVKIAEKKHPSVSSTLKNQLFTLSC